MKARLDSAFSKYLLRVNDGNEECDSPGRIKLTSDLIVPYEDDVLSLRQLIDVVFPDLDVHPETWQSMIDHAILTTKND